MREKDATETLNALSAALGQSRLNWLIREVSAAVQEGRSQEKVKVRRSRIRPRLHPIQEDETERGQSREYTRSLPYSPQEQLTLLTDAIRGVFEDSASLNEALVAEYGEVRFQSEGRFAEEGSFKIDQSSVASHLRAQAAVADLIARLLEEAEQ
ncbi:MAG: hypothetical protein ABSE46_14060 [Terracidiphilus sp.]|jgi:hypothetical protein